MIKSFLFSFSCCTIISFSCQYILKYILKYISFSHQKNKNFPPKFLGVPKFQQMIFQKKFVWKDEKVRAIMWSICKRQPLLQKTLSVKSAKCKTHYGCYGSYGFLVVGLWLCLWASGVAMAMGYGVWCPMWWACGSTWFAGLPLWACSWACLLMRLIID
jgi:hypothetical protein